jgi:tricorn protease
VAGDVLAFVADDDVWVADLAGGRAHRVTDSRTAASHPVIDADRGLLAYTGRDAQHPEAYAMPVHGGPADRWSFLGAGVLATRAWHPDGRLVVATNAALPFDRDSQLVALGPTPGLSAPLGWGSAHEVAFGLAGRVLVGRHTTNQGRWKRYRGGTAGQLWLDADGTGTFARLLGDLPGDVGSPMLVGDRVWFVSDHDGVGNLWSCDLQGADLQRHSAHEGAYARFAATDGRTVVWSAGGDLHALDVDEQVPRRLDVRVGTPRVQRSRTTADPARWLQSAALHPKGTHLALRVRGRAYVLPLHDGPARQVGARQGANLRLVELMADGERVVAVGDESGEERLEVHGPDGLAVRVDLDLGVPTEVLPAPVGDLVAVADQQGRLRVLDVAAQDPAGAAVEVAASPFGVDGLAWSPDGRWLAWSHRESNWSTASIRLWRVGDPAGAHVHVTDARAAHRGPAWTPDGHHLLWIAATRFAPVPDGVYVDHAFPHPDVVLAAVLAADGRAPLDRPPRAPGAPPPRPSGRGAPDAALQVDADEDDAGGPPAGGRPGADGAQVRVDADGLADRVVPLPLPTGRYRAVWGLHGKVLALGVPLRPPHPPDTPPPEEPTPPGQLEVLDLDSGRHEVLVTGVTGAALSADARTVAYTVRRRLRVVRAGVKPPEGPAADGPPRASGWVDLGRLTVVVDPPAEWRQVFLEAWRLQRDLFWHPAMSGVDWDAFRDRYLPLVDRLASRAELSDLIWEMLGELGTGHAYERGGDHPPPPPMPLGRLGADLALDDAGRWVVRHVLRQDPTDPVRRRPLAAPGVLVGEGAAVLAVDGVPVDAATSPASLLVDRAGKEVVLRVQDPTPDGADGPPEPRDVAVRLLRSDAGLRYADWVEGRRAAVLARGGGRVGYVHVPDMGGVGFAEFHRQYLTAAHAEALVVDVRFNGGGNVSSLLLEKLAGRRIAYQLRRSGALEPYPHHAPAGPLVAIANERCGSDGDVFVHAWKRLGLGPVVGTRTWGGVIGIQPRHSSADGTVTTQPAFAFWFDDVGWGLENRGTDPTHPVEVAPHDAAAGRDPQLDLAVDLALQALATRPPPPVPDLGTAPDLGAARS